MAIGDRRDGRGSLLSVRWINVDRRGWSDSLPSARCRDQHSSARVELEWSAMRCCTAVGWLAVGGWSAAKRNARTKREQWHEKTAVSSRSQLLAVKIRLNQKPHTQSCEDILIVFRLLIVTLMPSVMFCYFFASIG